MIPRINKSFKIDNIIYDKRIINNMRMVFFEKIAKKAEINFYKKILTKIYVKKKIQLC